MPGKILVLGASGNVGRPLVAELVKEGASVKAASREGKSINGAEGVKFDLHESQGFADLCEGVDRIYMMIPTGFTGAEKLLAPYIEYAAKNGIRVVLHTALEASVFPDHAYCAVEQLLKASGAAYTIVRPSWYMENFHMFWAKEIKAGKLSIPAYDGKMSLVAVADIAKSAAAVLLSEGMAGKEFNITGPEALSFGDALGIISEVTGREVVYEALTVEESIARQIQQGATQEEAEFFVAAYNNVRMGRASGVSNDVKSLTGSAPETFKHYVEKNRALFV